MGRGYVRRWIGSAPSRTLVCLLSAAQSGEPESHRLTQEGIAHEIRSGRSTVAKALLRLNARNFIEGRREHVSGHRKRKHVYRLTEAGWHEAVRQRARLERAVVLVHGLEEKPLRVRASELPDLFPSLGNFSQVLARVEWGALSTRDPSAKDIESCLPVAWGTDRPQPRILLGRSQESQQLDAWFASPATTLTVTGIAGIGKTALMANAVARWRPRNAVYWFSVRPWSSPAALTADLAKFLAANGRRGLERALVDRAVDEAVVQEFLRSELRSLRAVLVYDDVHAARPAVRRRLRIVASAVEAGPCRLVFVGRSHLPPAPSGPDADRAPEMRLGPLDDHAASQLLQRRGWDLHDPVAARIARKACGNPLLLLLGAQAGVAAGREIARYLEDEVWSALPRAERRALEAVCCLRRGAPQRALLAIRGVEADALRQLERKDLLDRTASGSYLVHPSIHEFVQARTPGRRARAYHGAVTQYFLSLPGGAPKLEALYHALESGRPGDAANLLRREGETLLNSVSLAALRDILEPVDPASLEPAAGAVLAEAQADALRREGSLRPAQARYDQALRLADPSERPGDRARILRKLAELDRLAARHGRARDRILEAAHLVDLAGDLREASNVHREFALLEMAAGRLGEAANHLERSLRAARRAGDSARFSRALIVFGTLEAARGRPKAGLERKLLALRHAEASGELLEVARDAISVGVSFAEMKRFAEALPYYEKGLRIARLLGDIRLVAISQLDLAGALLDLGRWDEAGPALNEADRLYALLGERVALGMIAIARGQLEMGRGRWRRAVDGFEGGLRILRASAGPFDLARGLSDVGGFYSAKGEHDVAAEHWREGLRLARALRNADLISEIEQKLSAVQETPLVSPVPARGPGT